MGKRTTKRIPVSLEADLVSGNIIYKAFIANISEKGLCVIAAPGEKDFANCGERTFTVKIHISSGQCLKLQCKVTRSTEDVSKHSLKKMGLEIPDPPAEFKEFYKASYYKIKKEISHDAIAVIGMACYYPGAPNLKSFWENILARRREFRRIPDQRLPISEYYDPDPSAPDKTYANRAAVIDGFEFDWIKRGIPKTVVESSDIVHWLALEVALRVMEDAGYSRENIPSDRSGVILGNTLTGEHSRSQNMRLRWPYVKKILKAVTSKRGFPPNVIAELIDTMEIYYKSAFAPVTEDTLSGNLSNTIAGRICNFLDLRGGGYIVDGACSSSLIAVATAATALSNGTLDLAVAGGIDISLDTFELIGFAKTNALTREDMQVYDRHASGFIPGEGCGLVVLKRLQDAHADGNYIYAVLRGWGISSDGKGGMMAPKAQTQALAIRRAYGKTGYSLREVDFIEGHGTGTIAGDKAELEGIADAMGDEIIASLRSCGITSLKSLIGHTKAASGIGAFIKAVMAVNRRVIPPTAGCKEPNPVFYETARRVYPVIQGEIRSADDSIRAGISGMGFGGINCHVTIESAGEPAKHIEPSIGERELLVSYQDTELFVLSAESQQKMNERVNYLKNLVDGISIGEMVDLSRHLTRDVSADNTFRIALIATFPEGLIDCLERVAQMLSTNDIPRGTTMFSPNQDIWVGNSVSRNRIGFLFPGQGSQQVNMGRLLVERYPWARDFKDKVESWLSETGHCTISECIYRPLDRALNRDQIDGWKKVLSRSEIAQPAICMTSLLWLRYLENLGIKPVVDGGHSLGELTAFYAAGAFDAKALLWFSAIRGRMTAASEDNPGIMASFGCSREKVEELLKEIEGYAVVANINSPMQTVISGERSAVEQAVQLASLSDIKTKYLPVSNAFHSRFMTDAADKLYNQAPIPETLKKTKIKLITCMDGKEIKPGTNLRSHFARQITDRVDFISLINTMKKECDLLLEVGPGRVLSDLVKSIIGIDGPVCLPIESRSGDDRSLNVFLGCYFVYGGKINWPALFENRLVRPFVSASERIFIDNPCERFFAPADENRSRSLFTSDNQSTMAPSMVLDDTTGLFSRQQIDFIHRLIHTELQKPGAESKDHPEHSLGKPETISLTRPDSVTVGDSSPGVPGALSPDVLLQLASEITGFPMDSISLSHRLLDDLNLDSIKAGQFVAKAVKLYGVGGKLDPTTMANSSLQEIYDRIEPHISSRQLANEPSDENLREQPLEVALLSERADNWVRDFRVAYVELQRTSPYSFEQVLAAASEEKRQVLIISDDATERLCSEMQGLLTQKGVSATSMDFKDLSSRTVHDYGQYDYFVFLLPQKESTGLLTRERVYDMASRIHCIGTVITSMKVKTQKPTYAIVQFGNGDFYKSDRDVSIEAKGSTAFLCSIHLENPAERIRVLEFSGTDNTSGILQRLMEELRAEEEFSIAAFDSVFIRRVPVFELAETRTFKDRKIHWTNEDVVLITGGAKGITAECARAFAMKTGVKLALVGRTVLIDKDEEIQQALQRYRESGIICRYYACDISEKQSVIDLKKRIERDLGAITGVIHGAAINRPRRAEQVTLDEAISEIAPKLLGAINICETLKASPPKLFVGFSSIIGVTGMMGNAWYGFSNEILNLFLQGFASCTGITEVLSLAFSIWDEVGMGKRMGSLAVLSSMGIHPIPRNKGVAHFMQLVEKDPGAKQVVVASRLGGLSTLRKQPLSKPRGARFLEEILFYEKGVEIEAKAVLTLGKDPYLRDHLFKGTYLFPTVFGIEAMAQAVLAVTGIGDIDYLQLENILLSYPITVEPDAATEIRIRALIEDSAAEAEGIRVKAGITVDQTGFSKHHFEATFVFHTQKSVDHYAGTIPETFLDIKPEEDLYRRMLFQGGMFQRIKAIRSLRDTQCAFDSEMEINAHVLDTSSGQLVTGDPFFRDTLLQSVQLILTDLILLPVEIEKWKIFLKNGEKETHTVVAELLQRGDDIVTANVYAIDTKGRTVETLQGYKTKVIERVQNAPRIDDLRAPDNWDESQINNKLQYYCQRINKIPPVLSLRHQSGLHEMEITERHRVEKELFGKAYEKLKVVNELLPNEITILWTEAGKPFVKESDRVGVSCSHDARLCLCVVGQGEQGCDIETISHRSEEEWEDLLGAMREPLLKAAAGVDKSLDRAGSRIWCALEALRKAIDMNERDLTYEGQIEECLIFKGGDLSILTFPVTLLRGCERMLAIVLAEGKPHDEEELETGHPGETLKDAKWGTFIHGGPQGQKVFAYQFPLGLRDSSTIGGGVYFANYFHWLGKVREMTLKLIDKYIADMFFSGHFMVTNYSATAISGDVRNHEIIDARVWIHKMFGFKDSSLLLHFEWRKLLADRRIMSVAFSEHQVSWVRAVGHGVVEPVECPEFFMDFLQENHLLPEKDSTELHERSSGNGRISITELGNVLYEGNLLGENNILEDGVFDTTMEHSNLAQNIYFSNYFIWQGHLRDRYLFKLSPEQYRKMDRNGQFVCVHSQVTHLREAMPFDRILVTMKLRRRHECGIDLYFEYFRVESNGKKVKLAHGDHTLAWVRIDSADNYVPQKLPQLYAETILNGALEQQGLY